MLPPMPDWSPSSALSLSAWSCVSIVLFQFLLFLLFNLFINSFLETSFFLPNTGQDLQVSYMAALFPVLHFDLSDTINRACILRNSKSSRTIDKILSQWKICLLVYKTRHISLIQKRIFRWSLWCGKRDWLTTWSQSSDTNWRVTNTFSWTNKRFCGVLKVFNFSWVCANFFKSTSQKR